MDKIQKQVAELLTSLDFQSPTIDINDTDESVLVTITVDSPDSGMLIGYHGETIDALQLIVSLLFNHGRDNYKPVEVDINEYRQGRKENLEKLADEAAQNAVSSGREIILPPLSSRERRLIHLHLGNRDDVTTYSEGEGSNRRLIVRPNLDSDNQSGETE